MIDDEEQDATQAIANEGSVEKEIRGRRVER